MKHLVEFSDLNESYDQISFKNESLITIKGLLQPNGTQRLYLAVVDGFWEGEKHLKAKLSGIFYIVKDGGMNGLWPAKISGDLAAIGRAMGLRGYTVGLNYNKCPMWQDALKYTDPQKFLNDYEAPIRALDLYFPY